MALTPLAPTGIAAATFGNGRVEASAGTAIERDGRLSIRVSSRVGSLPVEFELQGVASGPYRASVFDTQGHLVRRWEAQPSRGAKGEWRGTRDDGSSVRSGVYFLRVEAMSITASAKLVVAR